MMNMMNMKNNLKTPMALLSGRAMGDDWKASHGIIFGRRDMNVMTNTNNTNNNNNDNERLKEIEVTLNIRTWLSDKDMDSATYQEMFDLMKELNS